MLNRICNQEDTFRRSCILVSLILSSCSLEYGMIESLKDSKGHHGISSFLNNNRCRQTWSALPSGIATCFPKVSGKENCMVLSSSYNVREAKELYVNIQTETRVCTHLIDFKNCTGKFHLSVHYQINESIYKSFILPDEIPKNVSHKRTRFIHANDIVSFSVDQNYKSMKLGFQAPFYCGVIQSVSVYYYICPANTNALVDFLKVTAPSKVSSPSISVGTCTKNAVKRSSSHHLSRKCYYNGTAEVFGDCECEAGYTKNKKRCIG